MITEKPVTRYMRIKVSEFDNLMHALEVFPSLKDFPPVKTSKRFTGKESFDAVNAARDYVKKLGYSIGSMCYGEPIALAKGVDYIAKWYNIKPSEYSRIEGLVLSKDFRDGDVYFVEF